MSVKDLGISPGVIFGEDLKKLFSYAKKERFAIPAVNVIGTNSINAVLEAAKKVNSPVIIQLSNGGASFYAGKGINVTKEQEAAIQGSTSAALHVHTLAEHYGIPVILHTDHCAKKLLPWVRGLLDVSEEYFLKYSKPLYSSHMIDLSEESHKENMDICSEYLERMADMGVLLEIEIGITGGEEDGVDNRGAHESKLYTTKEDIRYVFDRLSCIKGKKTGRQGMYTIAAAFGNVHGVYKVGNVELEPKILFEGQKFIKETRIDELRVLGLDKEESPLTYVFHGGSGSPKEKITEALGYGVVKMNIDTDVQWAMWDGVRQYEAVNYIHLQAQLGTTKEGSRTDFVEYETPNKKLYDPRVWLRKGEESVVVRLQEAFKDLNCLNRY